MINMGISELMEGIENLDLREQLNLYNEDFIGALVVKKQLFGDIIYHVAYDQHNPDYIYDEEEEYDVDQALYEEHQMFYHIVDLVKFLYQNNFTSKEEWRKMKKEKMKQIINIMKIVKKELFFVDLVKYGLRNPDIDDPIELYQRYILFSINYDTDKDKYYLTDYAVRIKDEENEDLYENFGYEMLYDDIIDSIPKLLRNEAIVSNYDCIIDNINNMQASQSIINKIITNRQFMIMRKILLNGAFEILFHGGSIQYLHEENIFYIFTDDSDYEIEVVDHLDEALLVLRDETNVKKLTLKKGVKKWERDWTKN